MDKMDEQDENQMLTESCDVCGEEFKTVAEVEMHMKKEHPEEYQKISQSAQSM